MGAILFFIIMEMPRETEVPSNHNKAPLLLPQNRPNIETPFSLALKLIDRDVQLASKAAN